MSYYQDVLAVGRKDDYYLPNGKYSETKNDIVAIRDFGLANDKSSALALIQKSSIAFTTLTMAYTEGVRARREF